MNKLLIYLSVLLISCSTPIKPTAILTDRVVHVDARALEPCNDLVSISDTASFEELLTSNLTNFQIYSECKAKQNASIVLLKQFANIKEPNK
mgnify:FL=1